MKKTVNISEFRQIAEEFTKSLKAGKTACVIGLHGDLGAGKTTFVQNVAKTLGISETVNSPTFVIEKLYSLDKLGTGNFEKLIHIDAYRLDSGKELLDLGWQEISKNPKNLIFIEWPERVADVLPKITHKINFRFVDEEKREIDVE